MSTIGSSFLGAGFDQLLDQIRGTGQGHGPKSRKEELLEKLRNGELSTDEMKELAGLLGMSVEQLQSLMGAGSGSDGSGNGLQELMGLLKKALNGEKLSPEETQKLTSAFPGLSSGGGSGGGMPMEAGDIR